jgi:hypothetical protein
MDDPTAKNPSTGPHSLIRLTFAVDPDIETRQHGLDIPQTAMIARHDSPRLSGPPAGA